MILTYLNKTKQAHPSAYVAPTVTVCGDGLVAAGCRIMFGACLMAEGEPVHLGETGVRVRDQKCSEGREQRAAGDTATLGSLSER
jgi:carbonic anhydrase/acetyltransferase-like protein (isoleucine patch superfamily)